MTDVILGGLTGLFISSVFILILYLWLDFTRLRLIKFRAEGNDYWEIAFSEKELFNRLNGRMADVIMPERPVIVRMYRKVFSKGN